MFTMRTRLRRKNTDNDSPTIESLRSISRSIARARRRAGSRSRQHRREQLDQPLTNAGLSLPVAALRSRGAGGEKETFNKLGHPCTPSLFCCRSRPVAGAHRGTLVTRMDREHRDFILSVVLAGRAIGRSLEFKHDGEPLSDADTDCGDSNAAAPSLEFVRRVADDSAA
jgi:hypothetical protein